MAKRRIRIWPDPALREVAKPVEVFDDEIRTLVTDLFETMYASKGVGLAATQVAEAKRLLIIDLDPRNESKTNKTFQEDLAKWGFKGAREFINPEITKAEGSIIWNEGCLSVPGYTDKVERHAEITVRAFDRDGKEFTLDATGLYAVAIQHEMDHLDGKVFVEYLSKLKRDVVRRKMVRIKAEYDGDGGVASADLLA